jgi:hypothetical protein
VIFIYYHFDKKVLLWLISISINTFYLLSVVLRMVWVRSDCSYKIVRKLSELQTLLKRGASMPESFFNLGIRFLAYREAKGMK